MGKLWRDERINLRNKILTTRC